MEHAVETHARAWSRGSRHHNPLCGCALVAVAVVRAQVAVLHGPCSRMTFQRHVSVHEAVPNKPSTYLSILSESDRTETKLAVCWAAFWAGRQHETVASTIQHPSSNYPIDVLLYFA